MKLTYRQHLMIALAISLVVVALLALGVIHPSPEVAGGALLANMTPAAARIIDPVLTTAAQGYKNADFVGDALFPAVPVDQRGGKVVTFGKEDFRLYSTIRTPGANTKRVTFGHSGASFALEQHALEGVVPFEIMQDANQVPSIDMARVAVMKTQNIIALRKEKAQADLATNAANYGASNKITLAGTDQWSDYSGTSDPADDIEVAKDAVRAQIGRRPNTIVMGAAVFSRLRNHPKVLDRIKYTGRDAATAELLAVMFGVQRVMVGDAVYENAGGTAMVDVWGKFVVVAYTEIGSIADMGLPSYGYTYQLRGHPVVESPYQDRPAKSWVYPVTDENAPVIAGASAGYLISAAVA
jgi:hypothetical protein